MDLQKLCQSIDTKLESVLLEQRHQRSDLSQIRRRIDRLISVLAYNDNIDEFHQSSIPNSAESDSPSGETA